MPMTRKPLWRKTTFLVPYHNIEVKTKFLEQGITYDELSEEDKARYEEDFTDENGAMPDYLGNFEFFCENKEGLLGNETLSLYEAIFAKRVRLIYHLQESVFIGEPYQAIRTGLIEAALQQINVLNIELVSVKMQLQYIEKYKRADAFVCLSDLDKHNLITFLAPIVYMDDTDEYAKRFDNFMYGMMIAQIEGIALMRSASF